MAEEKNKKIIFIVEDDPFVRDIYQTKIAEEGYQPVIAINGAEAVKKLEEEGFLPDLILLDIVMPYMDGLEALEKIKIMEKMKQVPIILLTNLGQKDEIQKGISLGASDYLIKSHFTPSEVMEKINNCLK